MEHLQIVNVWDVRKYNSKKTIPAFEMIEDVSFIGPGSNLLSCLGEPANIKRKTDGYFLTVGERGVVRIWCLERYVSRCIFSSVLFCLALDCMKLIASWSFHSAQCIYEQQSSDVTINTENEESRRGFTSAVMLSDDQGLLCATADQQFLFYCPTRTDGGDFQLNLYKRLVGYNDEILDLKFVGEDEQYLAVATNLEQVSCP